MPQLKYWNGSAWVNATIGAQGVAGSTGAQGVQGITGATPKIPYTFSTTTTASDTGAGFVRFNKSTIASVTQIYISETDALGSSRTGVMGVWDDSTGSVKSELSIANLVGGSQRVFNITGTITDNGTWRTIPVTYVEGGLPADASTVYIYAYRAGDVGAQGTTGAQGATGAQGGTGAQGTTGTTGTSGIFTSTAVSSNITLASLNNYMVDTTAARTLTLPASASIGNEINIFDATGNAATNNITVANNGLKINGALDTLLINKAYAAVSLIYVGAAYGWRVS